MEVAFFAPCSPVFPSASLTLKYGVDSALEAGSLLESHRGERREYSENLHMLISIYSELRMTEITCALRWPDADAFASCPPLQTTLWLQS
jgi:hypothetical protein